MSRRVEITLSNGDQMTMRGVEPEEALALARCLKGGGWRVRIIDTTEVEVDHV